jgi:hypothetical protein
LCNETAGRGRRLPGAGLQGQRMRGKRFLRLPLIGGARLTAYSLTRRSPLPPAMSRPARPPPHAPFRFRPWLGHWSEALARATDAAEVLLNVREGAPAGPAPAPDERPGAAGARCWRGPAGATASPVDGAALAPWRPGACARPPPPLTLALPTTAPRPPRRPARRPIRFRPLQADYSAPAHPANAPAAAGLKEIAGYERAVGGGRAELVDGRVRGRGPYISKGDASGVTKEWRGRPLGAGAVCAWVRMCMGPYVHGAVRAWGRTCMGPYVHGSVCAWGPMCMHGAREPRPWMRVRAC